MLSLTNTLTKHTEEFVPLSPPQVGMYNCGPTVYDRAHIGNLRAVIFADTLRRALERNGYAVTQVMNITDVGHLSSDADSGEDKMTKGLRRENLPMTLEGMRTLADRYIVAFEEDIAALNVLHPHVMPRATEHIPEQIALIERLEKNGFTYTTTDGVYFDTAKDSSYGKLGGISESSEEHARVEENNEKRNRRDFAVWKFNPHLGWESPWGRGFPGWHIECSAMSMRYLGETLDIHTGGIEHIPVHHNNEIAQAENATGKPFSRYWVHNDHVLVENGKMAKSEGTGYTLDDLRENGITPLAYRYWVLTGNYRSPLNFTWDAIRGAQNAYDKLIARVRELPENGAVHASYRDRFTEFLNDDLGTPNALALLWEMLKDGTLSDADKRATALDFDQALGLSLAAANTTSLPEDVADLLAKREDARERGDWKESDTLRDAIEKKGFSVKDTKDGPKVLPIRA